MKNESTIKIDKLKNIYDASDLAYLENIAIEINKIKKEKNAIILAHNYMTPDIYHLIADFVGDSLALAIEAKNTKADIIIMAGVHFMAETAKLLNPKKKVIIPDLKAGCSLADSITGKDVRNLKKKYPGIPVITYVNTSVDVKAETDICCTSGNVEKIIKSLNLPEVILIPDKHLANNVEKKTGVKCITWEKGACEVHELFSKEEIEILKKEHDDVVIIAHPECPKDVVDASDFSGSTAGMINYVVDNQPKKVALITECSMASNIAEKAKNTEFLGMCRMCPHMKKITLENILSSLKEEKYEVTIPENLRENALKSVDKMLAIS